MPKLLVKKNSPGSDRIYMDPLCEGVQLHPAGPSEHAGEPAAVLLPAHAGQVDTSVRIREAAKKVIILVGRPLRPSTPPPSS